MPAPSGLLQRKCAWGNHIMAGGECEECSKKRRLGLQTKLKINEPGDVYEQEADRIANQVMATPSNHAVGGAPPYIQRFAGQSNGQMDGVPASVDLALASPSRPLDPALRQDMEQRFAYDFSRVRVHSGAAAEQSSQDVNARAYTVGRDIVFGHGQYAPETADGQRLLAHELAHVAQQSSGSTSPMIQRRLIVTGGKADVKAMLGLLESASGLTLKQGSKNEVLITGLADQNPSFELSNRLWAIIDDPKQDAEIHLGRKQAGVLFGAFPADPAKPVQEIRIDQMLALEKGAPGSGVAKLAHEIVENYEAHALTGYRWAIALSASHEKAKTAENLIEGELGHPGSSLSMFSVYLKPGKGKPSFNRWIEDRENYFLVWDQSLDEKGIVSNARRAPRVNVSTYTIDGFTAGSDTLPKAAAATIAALTADMKNNPTASALVKGFASVGGSPNDNARLADGWAKMVQDKIIELTGDVLITNWRRFHLVGIPALNRNSVVITVDRPDL